MTRTRYREERTLVRGLRPLRGEDHAAFKAKISRLRKHFERFNVDVSELCQWAMTLRPNRDGADPRTRAFWEFLLEPGEDDGDGKADRLRLAAFRAAAGWASAEGLPPEAADSARFVATLPLTPTAERLFARLNTLNAAHLLVLLKAAAEWIDARYERGRGNWERGHVLWEAEKREWEKAHPALTPEARAAFTEVFKALQIRLKRPRVCAYERLKEGRDDCEYAGERVRGARHGPLCAKYDAFLRTLQGERKKRFAENAEAYLSIRRTDPTLPGPKAMEKFLQTRREAKGWFPPAWAVYKKALGLDEVKTLVKTGRLPHCVADWERCLHNPHTDACVRCRDRVDKLDPAVRALEPLYREWRRDYLAGPRKPSFRYPSSRELPMPKIFGRGFFEADFANSVLCLRLDDMAEGEFLDFGFKPWPRDYDKQPEDLEITSAHVNFAGVRARVGFRFEIPRAPSRFRAEQDEIDLLRSREYPRRAQDALFLEAARELLLKGFAGNAERDLRLLAVDLGTEGAGAAVFQGKRFEKAEPLKIVKMGKLLDAPPEKEKGKGQGGRKGAPAKEAPPGGLGLGREHVGRHLDAVSARAAEIAEKRLALAGEKPAPPGAAAQTVTLGRHDLRRLTAHVRWMIRDWVRLNARRIADLAERERADLIVFESLRGFTARGYDRFDPDQKRRLAFFAYGRIRRKVAEKAVERGMRVVVAPYFSSSQVCAKCGLLQTDKKRLKANKAERAFACEAKGCGFRAHSDENAARVLARVFWGEIALPEEPPGSS